MAEATPLVVSSPDRIVFPEVGVTKADVVGYLARIAARMLPHVAGRPLTIRRFPKGLAAAGFYQKNVPAHYPPSFGRVVVPREGGATTYPVVREAGHLPYLANQGALELHIAGAPAAAVDAPDRLVIDLDPPAGALAEVRAAARWTREALAELGLPAGLLATGSKGYHVVAPLAPGAPAAGLALAAHQLATLLAARRPEALTVAFRIARRGGRVFVDWLRNDPDASAIAPYSLRATPRATIAAPIAWDELDAVAPDGWSIADADALAGRADPLAAIAAVDGAAAVAAIGEAFAARGLVLEPFDRFRS
jgi:bifunctional non-homologous end joining protein LigD